MKLKNLIYATTLATILIGAGGCKKDKFDINSNPDAVTDVSVTPSVLLPGAQQVTSAIIAADFWWLQMWMGYWARSGSYQSITDLETYRFTNDFQVQVWNDLFSNANNYHIMMTKAKALDQGFYEAVGRIMKSHNFQMLVDVYNNVPYSEAFQGAAVPTPKYDKGEDIYKDIFRQLDTAIALLQGPTSDEASNPDKETADLVYKGDNTLWIKFANTLRLRMIMHLHNGMNTTQVVPGFDIAGEVAKITSEGFLGTGQSAHLNPGFSGTKPSPYYRFYHTNEAGSASQRDHIRASAYAIGYYDYNGDPRIGKFYTAVSGSYEGIPFGTPSGPTAPIGSALSTVRGTGLIPQGASSRAWIMTSVESFFLQAEARHRGVLTSGPTAAALLTSAITESFLWLGLTAAQANTYITNNATWPDVDYNATGGGIFTIMTQKWFALNSIATLEIWTDYRRTDYELGTPVGYDPGPPISEDPGNTATEIPKRLLYPQSEYNYNAANVGAEGTLNVFTSRIFWDLN